jgi:hypothetical protein
MSPVIRMLLGALILVLIAGCAAADDGAGTSPPSPRWAVLGDGRTTPEHNAIAAALQASGDPAAADVLTLAVAGAGLESVVTRQLSRLPFEWDAPIVFSPGQADALSPIPPTAQRYSQLIDALLMTLRRRGPLVVSTIPETFTTPASSNERLNEARRLRRVLEYNDAIRSAAVTLGAVVLESDSSPRFSIVDSDMSRSSTATSFDASSILGRMAASNRWLAGFDDASQEELRHRAASARAAGQRLDVLAKLGDSITSSPSYLTKVTVETILNSPYAELSGTLRYFSQTLVPDGVAPSSTSSGTPLVPSPARRSLGSDDRWYVTDLINGGSVSALARELESIRPGIAVVMFGTNDLTLTSVETFEEHLHALLEELDQRHVLPILNTIPTRRDQPRYAERVPAFNAAIRAMAAVHQVPLIEYGAAMAGLPNAGLSEDGIHPSVCPTGAGSLSPDCLRYGYNLRNLLTLLALDKLQQSVLVSPTDRLVSQTGARQ